MCVFIDWMVGGKMIHDFGKMGIWSEETLFNMVEYGGMWHDMPYYTKNDLVYIYEKKQRKIDMNKEVKNMTVGEIIQHIEDNRYNEELQEDWNKMFELINNHFTEKNDT